jgi:hypothetical protein
MESKIKCNFVDGNGLNMSKLQKQSAIYEELLSALPALSANYSPSWGANYSATC